MDTQCRERWYDVLNNGTSKRQWSPAEDAALLELVNAAVQLGNVGLPWVKIATELATGRNDNQCKRRWHQLAPEESQQYRANAHLAQSILPRNHQGHYRHANATLTPDSAILTPY